MAIALAAIPSLFFFSLLVSWLADTRRDTKETISKVRERAPTFVDAVRLEIKGSGGVSAERLNLLRHTCLAAAEVALAESSLGYARGGALVSAMRFLIENPDKGDVTLPDWEIRDIKEAAGANASRVRRQEVAARIRREGDTEARLVLLEMHWVERVADLFALESRIRELEKEVEETQIRLSSESDGVYAENDKLYLGEVEKRLSEAMSQREKLKGALAGPGESLLKARGQIRKQREREELYEHRKAVLEKGGQELPFHSQIDLRGLEDSLAEMEGRVKALVSAENRAGRPGYAAHLANR